MNLDDITLTEEHNNAIITLINKIVAKSPLLLQLNSDSVVFLRLVAITSLIETTLCNQSAIVLKRNTTNSKTIHSIKTWLKEYYNQELITRLCRPQDMTVKAEEELPSDTGTDDQTNAKINGDIVDDYSDEDVDRDTGVIALLILFIAHKLRQSLPRINAYFTPEWQTLSHFETSLNKVINFDKLLQLVQNELCIKRRQLEITKSKLLSLQSTIKSRTLDQNNQSNRSNLFAEYEDNNDNNISIEMSDDDNKSVKSNVFVDHSSDDDFEPKEKLQKLTKPQKTNKNPRKGKYKKVSRGRGRPPKLTTAPKTISEEPKTVRRSRGRPIKPKIDDLFEYEYESDKLKTSSDGTFECQTCGKMFAKEYRLVRHSFTHSEHKQFLCDFPDCGESFDLKWKLSDHKHQHKGQIPDTDSAANYGSLFQCEWADCSKEFTTKRELTQHEHEVHANRVQSKYSCDWPQCREIFDNKVEWRKHVRTHGKIVSTECGFPGCHQSFFKLESLESHRKIHETFTLNDLSQT
ncbi:zinc finger and SCAN domain-containing protein 26-like [Oppia nitens]|uniref:zinc finger and SCAN domain-containing protein 26-like n=1 Tax=Oppia nitens TaxID=1686743 RepID=UPI0023DCA950|nr:zinc finger and SCAN domain-containing protein 26-like [Oppia nitens]